MVIVIVALLLEPTIERLVPEDEEELVKLDDDDERPGSVAPTRTAMMKFAPGT